MCISNVMTEKEMKEYLDKKPDVITAWKVFRKEKDGTLRSLYAAPGWTYKYGVNKHREGNHDKRLHLWQSHPNVDSAGFHCFAARRDAREWCCSCSWSEVIRKVLIKKKDIKNVGEAWGRATYIATQIDIVEGSRG